MKKNMVLKKKLSDDEDLLISNDYSYEKFTLIQRPFYFIRHGQTDWNAQNMIMGQTDIPLNQTGIQQALQLQKLISKYSIAHVFHSPLQRAVQTMDIATEHLACPKRAIDELKEWHSGEWEGKPKNPQVMKNIYTYYPPGGENWQQFFERTLIGINHALSHDAPVLIVAHSGTYAALCHYTGLTTDSIKNCHVVYFEPTLEKKTWTITYL